MDEYLVFEDMNVSNYKEFIEEIKPRIEFTILNCGYNCKEALEKLKNPPLFSRIVSAVKNFFTCCNEKSEQVKEEKISHQKISTSKKSHL